MMALCHYSKNIPFLHAGCMKIRGTCKSGEALQSLAQVHPELRDRSSEQTSEGCIDTSSLSEHIPTFTTLMLWDYD